MAEQVFRSIDWICLCLTGFSYIAAWNISSPYRPPPPLYFKIWLTAHLSRQILSITPRKWNMTHLSHSKCCEDGGCRGALRRKKYLFYRSILVPWLCFSCHVMMLCIGDMAVICILLLLLDSKSNSFLLGGRAARDWNARARARGRRVLRRPLSHAASKC